MAIGINEVYEKGKKSEYDEFWDTYQDAGSNPKGEKSYYYAFSGLGWTNSTFKPKYNIKMKYSNTNAFTYFNGTDLIKLLEDAGVTLDTSLASNLSNLFHYSTVTRVPIIDCRNATSLNLMFGSCYSLKYVEKLIVGEKNTSLSSAFQNCTHLSDITFEGIIANSVNLSSSPLSPESLKSVINALKDYSQSDKEYTYTVTFKASAFEALEQEGFVSPNSNTWAEFIDDLKWNLTLA